MRFEAKRLRVQLDEGELITMPTICAEHQTLPEGCQVPSPIRCWAGSMMACAIYYTEICEVETRPDCQIASGPCGFDTTPECRASATRPPTPVFIENDADGGGAMLMKEEDLPRFRQHLEAHLEHVESLASRRRKDIEGRLGELDALEGELGSGSDE